jgi:hypothetical protein
LEAKTTVQKALRCEFSSLHNDADAVQNGFTHGFVMEFGSTEDRDYYMKHDPAHLGFVKNLSGSWEKVSALDFSPGQF